jgi:hypothetical protein
MNKKILAIAAIAGVVLTTSACDPNIIKPKPGTTVTPKPSATATVPTTAPPVAGARPFFAKADWLWAPIGANPKVDPKSAAVAASLAGGQHVLDVVEYGVTLKTAKPSDPKVKVRFAQEGNWGPNPHLGLSMPLPAGTKLAPGGDAHYSVVDASQGKVFALWAAAADGKSAQFGSVVDINGDGVEPSGMTSTGSRIARHAGVITEAELASGKINHTMFFSSSKVGSGFRYPAAKTDQSGSEPGQEGMRVFLPKDVDISNLTGYQKVIAQALKDYGAVIGDGGGATVALIAEYTGGITAGYKSAGVGNDYASVDKIPWSKVQVLADSKG